MCRSGSVGGTFRRKCKNWNQVYRETSGSLTERHDPTVSSLRVEVFTSRRLSSDEDVGVNPIIITLPEEFKRVVYNHSRSLVYSP